MHARPREFSIQQVMSLQSLGASDERDVATQRIGKFLIFVDDELEKEKREKGRKRASAASSKDRRRRREGEESNAFPTKPCMWFLLARCISCCIFKNTILWREAPHVLGVPVPVDLPHSNGSSRPAKNIFSSKIDLQYLPVQS